MKLFINELLKTKSKFGLKKIFAEEFIIPALQKNGIIDAKIIKNRFNYGIEFTFLGISIEVFGEELTLFRVNSSMKYDFEYRLSFFRPYMMGIQFSKTKEEFAECVTKSVKLLLWDLAEDIKEADLEENQEDNDDQDLEDMLFENEEDSREEYSDTIKSPFDCSILFYENSDWDAFRNPFYLSFLQEQIEKGDYGNAYISHIEKIIKDYVVPAISNLEGIEDVKVKSTEINFSYNHIEYILTLSKYWDSKSNEWHNLNSFTFYAPWISNSFPVYDESMFIKEIQNSIKLWMIDNNI